MSVERNRAALERAVDSFSIARIDNYLELYHPNAILHFLPPELPQGREGARLFYTSFLGAFPDARLRLEGFVAEADQVACRFTVDGTHSAEFAGVPATHKHVSLTGITILRFADGQCVERWSEADFRGMYRQMGVAMALNQAQTQRS
jgi:steroid delta-isomerase-like uncharacterized protein